MKSLALLLATLGGTWFAQSDAADFAEFDAHLADALTRHRVPGVSVALIAGGQIVHATAAGEAREGHPMTAKTVQQVASISKSLTAWAAMTLVEANALDLDVPVSNYLTRWQLPAGDYDPSGITLRRLLSHTAGLSLGGYPGFLPNSPLPSLEASLSGETNGAGAVFLQSEPGTAWSYSGGGYTLVQLLIEEVSGQSFADYVRSAVLAPLAMDDSDFAPTVDQLAEAAVAYDGRGRVVPSFRFAALAAAGLHTTAEDLGKFVVANLDGGGVLSLESLRLLHTAAPAADGRYGLGFGLLEDGQIVWHNGGNIGWRSHFIVAPDLGQGIVVLSNSNRGTPLIDDVLCAWSESFAIDAYRDTCTRLRERERGAQGQAQIGGGILLAMIILAALLLARRGRKADVAWGLPAPLSMGALVVVLAGLFVTGWVGFWHTPAGVEVVWGFPHTYAIDFLPAAFHGLSPMVCTLALVLGGYGFTRRTRLPDPGT